MSLETNFQKFDQNISSPEQQTAAVAYLGQLALTNPAPEDLFADAAILMSQILPADLVLILELDDEKKQLFPVAISGSKEEQKSRTKCLFCQSHSKRLSCDPPTPSW